MSKLVDCYTGYETYPSLSYAVVILQRILLSGATPTPHPNLPYTRPSAPNPPKPHALHQHSQQG